MPIRKKIGTATCYEVNINDDRPEADYSTGAIVGVAKVSPPIPKAGGRWNTMEITARGTQMTVVLNGVRTAEGRDAKFASGRITIQYTRGVVKICKLQIGRYESAGLSSGGPACGSTRR